MKINNDPVYVRRRLVALAVAVIVLVLLIWLVSRLFGGDDSASAATEEASTQESPSAAVAATPKAEPEEPAPSESPAAERGEQAPPVESTMVQVQRITGGLTPKSVVASSAGVVFAQNMMYSHTVTVYDADGARLKTIDDAVDLADFGVEGHPGESKGAPVEMAFSPDGSTAWVSNYAMYGEGFLPEGKDACTSGEGISPSYVYEIDTATLDIERVVEVGAVPKYVAATPDGKHVLVSNWCSMDLSVIDAKSAKVVKTIPLGGENPRGIAVSPDSSTAYVANMGNDETVEVDLGSGEVTPFASTGVNPRHLLMSPKGDRLYITNAGSGTVSKVDTGNGEVVGEATVGADPRSMAMSPDGAALYVANYDSATVSKVRAEDMSVLQTVETDDVPIGITYEPTKKRVWVASYNGSLVVYDDSRRAA